MKIGVVLPQTEIGNDPVAIKAYAEAVEGMGFTHILVFDHVLGANPARPGGWKGPYTHRHGFHEPFVLFGFLAAATRRVELVTGIIILPQRQTALVAKQAAAVDVLSGVRHRRPHRAVPGSASRMEQGAGRVARDARHQPSLRPHDRARPGEAGRSRGDASALPRGRRAEIVRDGETLAEQRSDLPQPPV